MTQGRPPGGDSPYRGPAGKPRDKRQRAAERQARPSPPARPPAVADAPPRPGREQRLHGLNACLAMFAARPGDLRKVWLRASRLPDLKAVVAHCVAQRLGYSLVEDEDLRRLAGSSHHEGVVFDVRPAPESSLADWLAAQPAGPRLALWLDGVGNPHNLGAILRSAAHFGVAGLLLPAGSPLALSGAAARVAEGGAEQVPLVRLSGDDAADLAALRGAGFEAAATVVRGGESLYAASLPARLLLVMGAEQTGIREAMAAAAVQRLAIPGTGAVESLNVASASALFLGEWWRRHRA